VTPRPPLGTAHIIRGNALHLPLPDATVDLVVTSPPYFGLRSYQDGGTHYDGQIGAEPTPAEFVDALIAATREMIRVLKPTGSIWVNLGDKYAATSTQATKHGYGASTLPGATTGRYVPAEQFKARPLNAGVPAKSLIGIPWRYALRAIDDLGLILRAEIIWSKPNGLPESVTDRVRRSHETWFHFVRQPRYYSAVDEIREPQTTVVTASGAVRYRRPGEDVNATRVKSQTAANRYDGTGMTADFNSPPNPLGKLPGSVWEIPTQPLQVPDHLGIDHYAAFPLELPRRIIAGWSPRAVCHGCGFLLGSTYDNGMLGVRDRVQAARPSRTGRALLQQALLESGQRQAAGDDEVPATDDPRVRRGLEAGSPDGAEERLPDGTPPRDGGASGTPARAQRSSAPPQRSENGQPNREPRTARQDRTRQAAEAGAQAVRLPALRRDVADVRDALACPHCGGTALDRPVILDSFGGTGTTALAAKAAGRTGITIDMSADYCRLATWRTNDPGQLASAMQVDKPAPVAPDQLDLLEGLLA
jgi:DNA modification methylase